MAEIKKIKLNPLKADGTKDTSVILHPETEINSVVGLDEALNTKQDNLTQSQLNAVNSGITSAKVEQYDAYEENKQDTINSENPLPAEYVSGLEEELTNFVRKETKVAGINLEEDTENLQDYNYEKRVETIKGFQKGKTYYLKSSFTEEETNAFYSQIDYNGSAASYQVYYSNLKKFSNYVNNNNKTCIGLWRNDDVKTIILYDYERGTWVDINQRDEQGLYLPIPYDKENPLFQFVFDVDGEFNEPSDEPYKNYDLYLLRQLLVNEDDSEIVDTTREYDVSLKDNLDNYKDWKYGQKNQYKYVLKENINWEEIKALYNPNNNCFYNYYDGNSTHYMYIYTTYKNNILYYYIQIYNYYDWQSYYFFEEDGGYNNKEYIKKNTWYSYYNYFIHVENPQEVEIVESGIKNQEMFDLIFDKVPVYETLGEKIDYLDDQVDKLNGELKNRLYEILINEEEDIDVNTICQLRFAIDNDALGEILGKYMDPNLHYQMIWFDRRTNNYIYYFYNYITRYGHSEYLMFVINKKEYRYELRNGHSDEYEGIWYKVENNELIPINSQEELPIIDLYNAYNNYYPLLINMDGPAPKFEEYRYYEISYQLLEEKPSDWDILKFQYYELVDDQYKQIGGWDYDFTPNTFYEAVYNELEEEPLDWEDAYYTYYDYSKGYDIMQKIIYKYTITNQSLKEKFDEIEEEIESHVDTSYLKDRIYGTSNKIVLVDDEEYQLNDDYKTFFNEYSTSSSTNMIYNEYNMNVIVDDGNQELTPISPRGLEKVDDTSPEYIKVIIFSNNISPTPRPKSNGTKNGEIYDPGLVGMSYLEVYSSYGKSYQYYAIGNSWYSRNDEKEISIEDMPKIKLNTNAIIDEEMFKKILGSREITLEEKLTEGIKDWNYDVEVKEGGIKPIFDNETIVYKNIQAFFDADLTDDQTDTLLYTSNDFVITYTCDNDQGFLLFKYVKPNFEYETMDVYTNVLSFSEMGLHSEWGVHTEPFISESGIAYADEPITSQEELPIITNYSELNIVENKYVPIIQMLVKNFNEVNDITLEDKINDLPNWNYTYIKESYDLLDVPNWEEMLNYSGLDVYGSIYYQDEKEGLYYTYNSNDNHLMVSSYIFDGDEFEIHNIDFTDSTSGYEVKANTWYRIYYTGRYWDTKNYEEVTQPNILNIDKQYIEIEDLFNCVYKYTPEYKQTLDEKLKEQLVTFNATIYTNIWEDTENEKIAETYSYQAKIQTDYLIGSVKCEVEFSLNDMLSENYAPFYECNDETGELTIFATYIPENPITIKIIRWLGTKLDDINK